MEKKIPSLVIYWSDTYEILTNEEMMKLKQEGKITDLTPLETLIEDPITKRKAIIRGLTDRFAPRAPSPKPSEK